MSYISINSNVLIEGIEQKRNHILSKVEKEKQLVVEDLINQGKGFLFWKRKKTKEEATKEVNSWWSVNMTLRGYNSKLNKLKVLEELAITAKEKADGFVYLNKEDNDFVFFQ